MTEEVHKLGEVLRTAREAKGVDLARVERETKIRERYLTALEGGDYRDLPGAVYTKGFLRNYAAYLGLDPEYLIDLYRIETTGAARERPTAPLPPRPLGVRRSRTLVVSHGAIAAAILTLLVGGLVAWISYELVNFARMPELRVVDPAGDVAAHGSDRITVRGVTEPNATVTVSGLRENPSVTADDEGAFEVTVRLVPGSNEIRLTARDPATERDSEEVVRTVIVGGEPDPSPSTAPVPVVLVQPAADGTTTSPVPVAGTATPDAAVEVTVTLVEAAAPTVTVVDGSGQPVTLRPAGPGSPAPLSLPTDGSGAFAGSVELAPGSWEVSAVAHGADPATRRVTVVPADGVRGTLAVEGGDTYLEVEVDGTPIAGTSGGIVEDGEEVALAAEREVRILAGNAGAARLTLNGIALGAMGAPGAVVEWRITRAAE